MARKKENEELTKLAVMLAKEDIPFEIVPFKVWDFNVETPKEVATFMVVSPDIENRKIDAICHPNSYGWRNGLLEVLSENNTIVGSPDGVFTNATAEVALDFFKKAMEG